MKKNIEITIEKNIAIPERHTTKNKTKYAFIADLEIGDSFVVPNKKIADRITAAMYNYSVENEENKNGSSIRQQTDGTYRVWKTAKRPYKNAKTVKLDRVVNF